ncbi:hypothetical protein [Actinocorallia populi]|uniref:hypothetical protein n=1 Tax=Actinocorallia populi TaxID=2079200 RepID=UPI000D08E579|nr:hypothetical protein [Actinocorallia populi]
MTEQNIDPFQEALAQGGQRLVQLIAVGSLTTRGILNFQEKRRSARQAKDEAAQREAEAEIAAAYSQAYARFARALDPHWLKEAPFLEVLEAWTTAVPFANDRPDAARVVTRCEERLRDLHPHGMSHYDRFREAGNERTDAMREALPYLARDPGVRTGQPGRQRLELTANAADLAAESFPYDITEAVAISTRLADPGTYRGPRLERSRRPIR